MLDVLIAQILKNCRWLTILSEGKKVSERRDNEVGAPENRIEWLKPYPDAPARRTSITGTWIDRRRSAKDYNEIRN